jgi:ABC-2 type transport system ATP-binding protein
MAQQAAIQIERLSHSYGERVAVQDLTLDIFAREIFALLGPNGSGKTTLFRVLSTLVPLQTGSIRILGFDVANDSSEIRKRIGVVFQAPGLDKKLTVSENIRLQAALYGVTGTALVDRENELLHRLRLNDRATDRTETLSGGLRRRVELAKTLIHSPQLLLLDEPSTGLDPGARIDLWQYLEHLRDEFGVTVVLTTHLLEEADKADRIAILDRGKLVALGSPAELRASIGGDSITVGTASPTELIAAIRERFDLPATEVDGHVRLEQPNGHVWITRLAESFPDQIQSITLGKPSLEDVFIDKTGHRFFRETEEVGVG